MISSSLNLVVQNLECIRSGRRVFSGLSFRLRAGEMLHLRGANGSGKTSLLRIIAGLLPAASGEIAPAAPLRDLGHYIGHLNALSQSLCALDMLRFWGGLMRAKNIPKKIPKNISAEEILDHWHLRDVRSLPSAILSAGQARALSLCRLSLAARPLWLLDEPAAGLDQARADILHRQINDHLASGGMVILAEHANSMKNAASLDMDQF